MSDRVPPHDLQAEESLLGAMMLSRDAAAMAVRTCQPGDFYSPANALIFDAMCRMWNSGDPIDTTTLGSELERCKTLDYVGGVGTLVSLQVQTPATTSAPRYAGIVVEKASRRHLIAQCDAAVDEAYVGRDDTSKIIEELRIAIDQVNFRPGALPEGFFRVKEFIERPGILDMEWVIPGLIGMRHRQMTIATEGFGKTLLHQQLCLCLAQGIHPFTHIDIEPRTSLLIDAENDEQRLATGFVMIDEPMMKVAHSYDGDPEAFVWTSEQGLDLRDRRDRARLEAVLQFTKPDLICVGPLYKLFFPKPGEGWTEQALAMCRIFDDIRVRHNCAVLIEHHAPKGPSGGVRVLEPEGSAVYKRWLNAGYAWVPDETLNFGGEDRFFRRSEYRGSRSSEVRWPSLLEKSPTGLPWAGTYDATDAVRVVGPTSTFDPDRDPFT